MAARDAAAIAAKTQLEARGKPFLKSITFTLADSGASPVLSSSTPLRVTGASGLPAFTFDGNAATRQKVSDLSWAPVDQPVWIYFRPTKEGTFRATLGWTYVVCVQPPKTATIWDPTPYEGQRPIQGLSKGGTSLVRRKPPGGP